MEILLHWIGEHGFDLLGATGIVCSLLYTARSFRADETSRRIANLLTLTTAHREIWTTLYTRPEIKRVLDPKADLYRKPMSDEEALFVTLLLLHLNATWQATKEGVFRTKQAIEEDIRWFFSLPIPKAVWERSKMLQDSDFVEFVEQCLE